MCGRCNNNRRQSRFGFNKEDNNNNAYSEEFNIDQSLFDRFDRPDPRLHPMPEPMRTKYLLPPPVPEALQLNPWKRSRSKPDSKQRKDQRQNRPERKPSIVRPNTDLRARWTPGGRLLPRKPDPEPRRKHRLDNNYKPANPGSVFANQEPKSGRFETNLGLRTTPSLNDVRPRVEDFFQSPTDQQESRRDPFAFILLDTRHLVPRSLYVPHLAPAPAIVYQPVARGEPDHPELLAMPPYRPKFGENQYQLNSANTNGEANIVKVDSVTEVQRMREAQTYAQPKILFKATLQEVVAKAESVVHAGVKKLGDLAGLDLKRDVFYDAEKFPPRTCDICGEEKENSKFVHEKITATCTHDQETCAECLQTWLATDLDRNIWTTVSCPECSEVMQYADIQRLADPDIFAEYDRLLVRSTLSKEADFRWCPNPSCSSGQIHTGGLDAPRFQCIGCGHRYFITHNIAWHEGETCTEYDAEGRVDRVARKAKQAKEEQASIKLLQTVSKKCPGPGSDFSVQKREGCDAMKCSRCQHKFCWSCLASYTAIHAEGNSAHKIDCKHYRGPRRLVWH